MSHKWSLFHKVGNTKVIPLYFKIVVFFLFFLLVSNFSSNYINLMMNRGEQIKLLNELLIKDLKENYVFASHQFEVYEFDGNLRESQEALSKSALRTLSRPFSVTLGIRPSGESLYFAQKEQGDFSVFQDKEALSMMIQSVASKAEQGIVRFSQAGRTYFGYFKYHPGWNLMLIRAEDEEILNQESFKIFWNISWIILGITLISGFLGILILRHLFRFVGRITQSIMEMQETQELKMIPMDGAPNDDVTYLGTSFNALSSTIGNLLAIFRKFVTQDIAYKAYRDKVVKLEGEPQELAILFTDIKGFTFMTEVLGNDIIKLLNLHYDQAIRHIQSYYGIVGSIIGDALLAVYGSIVGAEDHKSLKALDSGFKILDVARNLRNMMDKKRHELLTLKGSLNKDEERVYKAVLLEVGVGIDGGEVFYGNIGSFVRMTNTVIGDNVNSASRLEGLTRVYKVPVIVSAYIRDDVVASGGAYEFMELDRVQVKGKTEGKVIFWPVPRAQMTSELKNQFGIFTEALQNYYQGNWKLALEGFQKCSLPCAEVFVERISGGTTAPKEWNGVWTMTSK